MQVICFRFLNLYICSIRPSSPLPSNKWQDIRLNMRISGDWMELRVVVGSAKNCKWYILVQQNTSFFPQSRTESIQLQMCFCFDSTMLACPEFVYFIPPFLDYCQNFKIRFLTFILNQISVFWVGKTAVSGNSRLRKDKATVGCNWVPTALFRWSICSPILPQAPLLLAVSLPLMLNGSLPFILAFAKEKGKSNFWAFVSAKFWIKS